MPGGLHRPNSPDVSYRLECINVLKTPGAPETVGPLAAQLADPNVIVRSVTVVALASIASPDSRATLKQATQDED